MWKTSPQHDDMVNNSNKIIPNSIKSYLGSGRDGEEEAEEEGNCQLSKYLEIIFAFYFI